MAAGCAAAQRTVDPTRFNREVCPGLFRIRPSLSRRRRLPPGADTGRHTLGPLSSTIAGASASLLATPAPLLGSRLAEPPKLVPGGPREDAAAVRVGTPAHESAVAQHDENVPRPTAPEADREVVQGQLSTTSWTASSRTPRACHSRILRYRERGSWQGQSVIDAQIPG